MSKQQVTVPDIGGAEGAEVIEVLVAVGDEVAVDQGLIVLESDKASMEIPSTVAGTVVELLVTEGQELAEGAPVAVVEVAAGSEQAGSPEPTPEPAPADAEPQPESQPQAQEEAAADAPAEAEETADQTVSVPDIGTDEAVELIEICVAVGDTVAEGDSLVVLESDKASMEVPSPLAGEVMELLVKTGDAVSQGDKLLILKGAAAAAPASTSTPEPSAAPATSAAAPVSTPNIQAAQAAPAPAEAAAGGERSGVYAGPAVRKLAREFGVALEQVSGSGPRGRVLKEDLQQFVQKALSGKPATAAGGSGIPAIPEIDFGKFGPVEVTQRSKLDKLTAANMHRSWLNVPHVTQFDEADITALEEFRSGLKAEAEQRGTRLTPMPFILKACAVALRDNPKFASSLAADGEQLVYKQYIHIGMAVDTPAGLMVPVIRDVDKKTIWELAEEVLSMAAKARDRKLSPGDMQGGCFTISSLGNIGGTGFTPIVNAPEVGILGVSRATLKPVWDGSTFTPRNMLPLALSYDHRVINGGDGGRFMSQLVALLGDIRRLVM
jgi:pyruvate dehydrogenase E2 component (dihydrolipoyllysine-residue acetyltransferase)